MIFYFTKKHGRINLSTSENFMAIVFYLVESAEKKMSFEHLRASLSCIGNFNIAHAWAH